LPLLIKNNKFYYKEAYMEELTNSTCEVCHAGAPQVSDQEIIEFLQSVPEWKITEENNAMKLTREYYTEKYSETINFVNKIADLAESEGHHPVMLIEFNKVTVWWWSHKIGGLHKNDFIMAAKTDELYKNKDAV
jgi:4a-hydroxytetrahydrobiopterin dehydratase